MGRQCFFEIDIKVFMKSILLISIILLLSVDQSFGQRYAIHPAKKESKQLISKADSLFFENELEESIKLYEQILELEGYSKDLLLNLSSMYCQQNDMLNCKSSLNQVLDSGFIDLQYLTKSEEFQNLRQSNEWEEIVNRCQQNFAVMVAKEKVKYPFIAGMIISSANDDQLALWKAELKNNHSHAYPDITIDSIDVFKQKTLDANLQELKIIFEKYGFLWESDIGIEASHAAWLIIQHADSDTAFQARYLDAMEIALNNRGIIENKSDYAYLYDRVQKNRNKPQRYGTQVSFQIITDEKTDEKHVKINPYTLESPDKLDEWRKEIGLSTWEEYQEKIKQLGGM